MAEGFSDQKLRGFCFDTPEFRPVHVQLAITTGKAEIITRLLEYADQNILLDPLLAWAKEQNPARYEQHQPYYNESATFIPHQTFYSSNTQRFFEEYLSSSQRRVPCVNWISFLNVEELFESR